ncbi:YjcG family protein [Lysinibacillus endophyticus]|uniref:YjcG family protein n=1 Tax=Ureibacillus endophyticus TaxID=1978490 RepID=UPI0020A1DD6E|nr:YjcG family protein [Lysinibacillus endophyticus]MCP1143835.1 YjcG family protein [Lysinibacillus endophyticus]
MKYGIVAFPSKKLQDLANTYRKRYDSHYTKITPHITLKEAFDADEIEIQKISKEIASIADNFAPLKIHASRISSFFPTTNVIFFRIEPTDQLKNLHQELQSRINIGKPKHVFIPHITIAQDLTETEHDDIFGQLRMIGINEQETIDRIHLLYQLEDGSWTTYETYRLTGDE